MNDQDEGVMHCEECGQPFSAYWLLVHHQNYAHQQPRTEQAPHQTFVVKATVNLDGSVDIDGVTDVGSLSVSEMATLNGMKRTNPEWLERYG